MKKETHKQIRLDSCSARSLEQVKYENHLDIHFTL